MLLEYLPLILDITSLPLGPIFIWKICPLFKEIGYSLFLLNCFVAIYYNGGFHGHRLQCSVYYNVVLYTIKNGRNFVPQLTWSKCFS